MGQIQSPIVPKRQSEHIEEDVQVQKKKKKKKKSHPIVAAFQFLLMLSCCGINCDEREDNHANSENVNENQSRETLSFSSVKFRSSSDRKKPPDRDFEKLNKKSSESTCPESSRRKKRDRRKPDPEKARLSKDKNRGSTRSKKLGHPGGNKTQVEEISISPELFPNRPVTKPPSNVSVWSTVSVSVHSPKTLQTSALTSCQSGTSLSSVQTYTCSTDCSLDWQVLPGVPSLSFPGDERGKTTGEKQAGSTFRQCLITIISEDSSTTDSDDISSDIPPSSLTSVISYPWSELSSPDLSKVGKETLIAGVPKTADESDQDHNSTIRDLNPTRGGQSRSEIDTNPSAKESTTEGDAAEYKQDPSSSRHTTPENLRLEELEKEVSLRDISDDQAT
ncbi:uncharacterized protein LOC117592759 [Esox lucius]|uniref:uncharacterized protein LOC117592759 n=1 Tax=Esox lucius TaxID=8010 RepID=UPI00147703DB|nr:uncharacterized protein LOC117592759 [Esox lucius]